MIGPIDPRELVHEFLATCSDRNRCHLCLRDRGHVWHAPAERVQQLRAQLAAEREQAVGAIVGAELFRFF